MSIYTKSERTVKNYTVLDAFNSARARLKKHGLEQVCVDKLKGRADEENITLEELNEISDMLVSDTLWYDGWKIENWSFF